MRSKLLNKSPFNYIGGKYKLLPYLFGIFPKKIGTMVDLFAGGGDVFINIKKHKQNTSTLSGLFVDDEIPSLEVYADRVIANDINYHVIGIYKAFQKYSPKEVESKIDSIIAHWGLTLDDNEAYNRLRAHYNQTKDPFDLYALVCYSYNYQFRFNSKQEYNNPFGRSRSWFNPTMRKNLLLFIEAIKGIEFSASDFRNLDLSWLGADDFVYADPPYLITTGSYNDGKRGFEGWTLGHEKALYEKLDAVDRQGAKFGMSNVIEHKGLSNDTLIEWMQNYNVHYLDYSYSNSCYQGKNIDKPTKEVLITNY